MDCVARSTTESSSRRLPRSVADRRLPLWALPTPRRAARSPYLKTAATVTAATTSATTTAGTTAATTTEHQR